MKKIYYILALLFISLCVQAQKTIYIPGFIGTMDLNNPASQWCYNRSAESENFVVFWEAGFGNDPSAAETDYRVNINTMLEVAELSYHVNIDSLGMAIPGSSVTDNYKMMIFLLYSTEWVANGSGQDETVGVLHVNPAAASSATVLAHEIGHCFQYITGCDSDGGFRYGFGENGSGGNGFWEQCAQWAAFKVYPEEQFRTHDFGGYVQKQQKTAKYLQFNCF
ncbi:MAG: DUF6055 domain-containing protein [Bacteroidales bacterium]|jgi:hypothetical protein|nr:DUF6055 domain-containing protein [Bacteroidales bacterium]